MLPPIDISYIADQISEQGEEIQRLFEETSPQPEPTPQVLLNGLDRLLDILRTGERPTPTASAQALRTLTGSEPEALLDHGLDLLHDLSDLARRLGLPQSVRALDQLALTFSCWMIRHGTELIRPEPAINAAAILANQAKDPEELTELFGLMTELMEGVGPDPEPATTQPWRILILNRAIVATRSYQPALMETAFDDVVEHLGDEAPDFFREGMGQMEALDYPDQIRQVMQHYFERCCSRQRLH
ncbi:hypothetical protein ThidrDRAFT_3135 [Thiorhodococcus drewsii AZ1]|uniref:Uncharacterized protein n=1 Tax=Thiorhodococcus drewsii AZ1 TaxID=765913 RepID=G2E4C2_9GAMM|nr:hypothetical protein [Thiorhodococcus drewsii]EGV29691.1 hypothetical protein ThidrDRAFT_3135 [Thiorhodococcus drewsii AZ1]